MLIYYYYYIFSYLITKTWIGSRRFQIKDSRTIKKYMIMMELLLASSYQALNFSSSTIKKEDGKMRREIFTTQKVFWSRRKIRNLMMTKKESKVMKRFLINLRECSRKKIKEYPEQKVGQHKSHQNRKNLLKINKANKIVRLKYLNFCKITRIKRILGKVCQFNSIYSSKWEINFMKEFPLKQKILKVLNNSTL